MTPRFLLDTHIVVRWRSTPKKLSREQARVLHESVRRREPVAISAMTLLEIALLFGAGSSRTSISAAKLLRDFESNPSFQILPLTEEIAADVASLGVALSDPADRAIVSTARVNKLPLITSDQRIIESNLVTVIW